MIYDAFQRKSIDYIKNDHSVIVSAPTGAGKTVIAEYVINDCLEKGLKAVYTSPIKALSNQKYRDFRKIFKDKIGILTGDVSINPNAPILIMTTEIFRNKVLEDEVSLKDYSWIVFDEIHYLDDYERGTVWEESLIFLPPHMKMLALSATIPNIDEFAAWLKSIHNKTVKIVIEEKRPVPLHFYYQCQGSIMDNIHKVRKTAYGKNSYFYNKGRRFYKEHKIQQNKISKLIAHLSGTNRLPAIYFSFSRKRCEYLANELGDFDFLSFDEKRNIAALFDKLCVQYGLLSEKSALMLKPLVEKGIAYHHAGMLPTLKEVVEQLFTSKLIKIIFTTETFALGINMPARTVVFDELRKFYGKFFAVMRTRDFFQMAGRAGRRGIDEEGYVYSRINPRRVSYDEIKSTIYGEPEKVKSRFNASYATILNLYEKYGDKIYEIYPYSFHYYQEKKKTKEKALKKMRAKVSLLKNLKYIKNGNITDKGSFASNVYGYELQLSEVYEKTNLEQMSEIELGVLTLALVFEPRKGSHVPRLGSIPKRLKSMTDHVINHIHYFEKKEGLKELSKSFHYNLSPALEAWMQNSPFDKILSLTDADEGEIVRNFRMAVQILREVLDSKPSPALKDKVLKTILLINRDIVDAEKQLRAEEETGT